MFKAIRIELSGDSDNWSIDTGEQAALSLILHKAVHVGIYHIMIIPSFEQENMYFSFYESVMKLTTSLCLSRLVSEEKSCVCDRISHA